MFTGIVQALVRVISVNRNDNHLTYSLALPPALLESLSIGASISVHGICQTVVNIESNEVTFDAIEETLKRTTLQHLKVGDWVNIERSAKMGDELGGHLMSGHIIGTVTVKSCLDNHNQRTLLIQCSPAWMKYILPKGFIGLNGASLTVGETSAEGEFFVHLIPETLRQTTFGQIQIGDKINLEISSQTQAIVDTVERILETRLSLNI